MCAPCLEQNYGAALLYFTGSKAHNIALRGIANRHKWKLNEYGLFSGSGGSPVPQEEVYRKLGLTYIPPEIGRTAARSHSLNPKAPQLVTVETSAATCTFIPTGPMAGSDRNDGRGGAGMRL
jgi:hypothetical protein